MVFIGRNLKHVHMPYSSLDLLIFFYYERYTNADLKSSYMFVFL